MSGLYNDINNYYFQAPCRLLRHRNDFQHNLRQYLKNDGSQGVDYDAVISGLDEQLINYYLNTAEEREEGRGVWWWGDEEEESWKIPWWWWGEEEGNEEDTYCEDCDMAYTRWWG